MRYTHSAPGPITRLRLNHVEHTVAGRGDVRRYTLPDDPPWDPPPDEPDYLEYRSAPVDTHGTAIAYNVELVDQDGGPMMFRPVSCHYSHGKTVPLLVDHDRNLRVGTATLVDSPHGLKFRADLDPCALRRIGERRSLSPAYIVQRDDVLYDDVRVVYRAAIDELSIVERSRFYPHTTFSLGLATIATQTHRTPAA